LDFARVHATTLLQLASRTIEFISNPPIQTVKISLHFKNNNGPMFLLRWLPFSNVCKKLRT
jgi:hypothetical protein